MDWLARFTIGQKVGGFAGLLVLLIATVGGISLFSLAQIVEQNIAIAEEDLPLAAQVEKITVHQLEQTIHFERGMLKPPAAASRQALLC